MNCHQLLQIESNRYRSLAHDHTIAGTLVGGMLGNEIGKRYGGAILDKMEFSDRAANNAGPSDLTEEIERLRKMRDAVVLTEEEFTAAKAKLLGL